MVTFRTRQSKEPFFQYRIPPIPQRERKTQPAFPISNPQQAVFTPPIRAAARLLKIKVGPRLTIGGIIFPHRAPLALCQIRTPPFPVFPALSVLREPQVFGG